ncbi:TPA: hypothetical protein N0F65_009499 [Lagenidium giganteum]|uniref:Tubby C-terminal domain-containing protein n=1 Tax=Lagenidium giganteum TaxID=4803 RepID=A0AAV2ZH32_9STRA|nr:TPA: hypothetical protein N0F65_009499 [Lagenidium giganteum]
MTDTARRPNLTVNTDFSEPTNHATVVDSPFGFLEKATKLITDKFAATTTEDAKAAGLGISQTSQAWGTSIRKEQFQDMDMLESGHAREYMAEECLSPTQSKSWTYSTVERTNKHQYKMYWNNDQFLLSAKQVGGTFFISQYEHFPDGDTEEPTGHYCAVLRKVADNNFKLYNCGCEGCDMSFNTFTCNNVTEDANLTGEGADRQLLADITHYTKAAGVVGSEMRCFSIIIPAVMEDKRSRVVWCPRVSRAITPQGGTPRGAPQRELLTSPSPHNRQHKFSFDVPIGDRIKIGSKLPVWCPEVNSLMLKFHGGRIREASAKNFMLMVEDEPIVTNALRNEVDPTGNNKIVMQFGKFSKAKFALDFRYPLAPIQAFAVGLSSCAWNVKASSR